jgi:hypothetical protein
MISKRGKPERDHGDKDSLTFTLESLITDRASRIIDIS